MMTPNENDTYSPMHVEESAPAPPRADDIAADETSEKPDKAD